VLPTKPAYKPDGSFNILSPDFRTSDLYNTIAIASMDKRYLKELSLRGNVSGEYIIIKNLVIKSSFGGDLSEIEEDQYNNPLYGDGVALAPNSPTFNPGINYNLAMTGRAISDYTRWFNWDWTNTISYKGDALKNGDLSYNVTGGIESQEQRQYFTNLTGRGLSISPLLYLQYPSSGATPTTTQGAISEASFLSYFTIGISITKTALLYPVAIVEMDHHVLDQMTGGVIFGLLVLPGILIKKTSCNLLLSLIS
jgi:hypothetical protein